MNIEKPKASDIKLYREMYDISLLEAKNMVEEINLHRYIGSLQNIEDLKKLLHFLVSKLYRGI